MENDFNPFKAIFENAPLGIFQTSHSGQVIDLNDEVLRIFGYDSMEDVKNRITNLSTDLYAFPEDRDRVLGELAIKKETSNFEIKCRKKNGEIIDAHLSMRPYFNAATNEQNYIGIVEDVTSKTKLQEQVNISEMRYRTLYENSNDAIIIYQYNHIIEFNAKAVEMFALQGTQKDSYPLWNIFPEFQPDGSKSIEKAQQLIKRVLGGESMLFDWVHKKISGEEFFTEVSLSKLDIGIEGYFQAIIRDISEYKQHELEQKKHAQRHQIYNSLLSELLRNRDLFGNELNGNLQKITELSGHAIQTNRASIWEFSDDFKELKCLDLYQSDINSHTSGDVINALYLQEYLSIQKSATVIAAEDVFTNPYTKSIPAEYFIANQIISLLDAPIWVNGKLKGVVCYEHSGNKRTWYSEDIDFARTIAAYVANFFEKEARLQAELLLKESEERIRTIFSNAPVGIVRTTPGGKILLANNRLAEIFDFKTPEAVINEVGSIADDIYHSESARAEILASLKIHGSHEGKYQIKTQKGKLRTINLKAIANFKNPGEIDFIDSIIEDITEKVELEKALKGREALLSSIINSLPFELWVSDRKGNITCQSAYSERYWGDITGKNIVETSISEAAKKSWKEKSQKVMQGEILDYDGQVTAEGKEYYFHRIMAPLTNENEIEGVISLSLDITGQKQAEKALKESEEKYRYLLENMNEVVMMVDNDDKVLYVNKKFTEKFGYTPDEIVGQIGYEKLLDAEDHDRIIEENKKRIDKIVNQYEITFKGKDGQKIDFLVSGAPIFDAAGKTIGSIGTMTDITDRKLAEKAIKQSEELFRNLIDLAPYSIVLNDMQGRYLMVNRAFTRDTGFEADEIVGKKSEEIGLILNAENVKKISEEIRKSGIIENLDTNLTGKNGKTTDVLYSAKIIRLNDEPALLSSSVDITEKKIIQKELELHRNNLERLVKERTEEIETLNEELTTTNEELYQNNEELNMLNEILASQKFQLETTVETLKQTQTQLIQSEKMASIGILTAGIAHEINNPVNFISSGITGLELVINDILEAMQECTTHCENIPDCKRKDVLQNIDKKHNLNISIENISKLLKSIHIGVERTTNIVKSLRTFSRLDNESRSQANIHELIDSSLTILNNKIKDHITVVKEYEVSEQVQCYPGKLSQVFLNLIMNAIQSIEKNGTIIITTRKSKSHNKVEIIIRDTGKGMSKEIQQKIFDPFFTTKPVGEGTGMGLSIVHGIIKDHSGEITVSSKLGHGTEFRIILPVN